MSEAEIKADLKRIEGKIGSIHDLIKSELTTQLKLDAALLRIVQLERIIKSITEESLDTVIRNCNVLDAPPAAATNVSASTSITRHEEETSPAPPDIRL